MSAGEWLVELLAWAALGTWWERNPRGVRATASPVDDAIFDFISSLPVDLWDRVRTEHRRRREALS